METALITSSVFLWLVVIGNVLLTLALVRRLNHMGKLQTREGGLEAGEAAPDFTAQTLDGGTKTLADYAGRSVAFAFISTTCRPCRDRLPMLERIGPEMRASGVDLVLISGDGREETQALRDEMDLRLPLLIAPRSENPFFEAYKVPGTPAFCLIDSEGNVSRANILGSDFQEWKQLARNPKGRQVVMAGD